MKTASTFRYVSVNCTSSDSTTVAVFDVTCFTLLSIVCFVEAAVEFLLGGSRCVDPHR